MKRRFLFLLIFVLPFTSCRKKDDVKPDNDINNYVYELMKYWYFWNDKLPAVNPSSYSSPEDLMEALRYTAYDRWSFISDSASYFGYFNSGQNTGFGCGFKFGQNGKLYVSYVYRNSPMAAAGVTRGWEVQSINGASVSSLVSSNQINSALSASGATSFTFADTQGQQRSMTISKGTYSVNTVLHYDVISQNGVNTGYLVFNSFIETSKAELDQAFSHFASHNVSELVLDLRYNGGGSVDVAAYLGACIGGSKVRNNVFGITKHNRQRSQHDTTTYFPASNFALNIDRLFVITTQSTASSSELVINSLKPYMPVYLVGSRTHGKPVGMYGWTYKGKVIVPISFEILNSNNDGRFFAGIDVHSGQSDDLTMNFGNVQEACLREALYYISNGHFTGVPARLSGEYENILKLSGMQQVTGSY